MKKTTRLCGILLAVVLLCLLVACAGIRGASSPPPSASQGGGASLSSSLPPGEQSALPGDVLSFAFGLDSLVYHLPMPFAELLNSGWQPDEEETLQELAAASRTVPVRLVRDGQELYVRLYNPGPDAVAPEDALVSDVQLSAGQAQEGGVQLVLPGGITFGASYNDVVQAYGSPANVEQADDYSVLTYGRGVYARARITVNKMMDSVSHIDISNLHPAGGEEAGTGAGGEEAPPEAPPVPAAVQNYSAPTSLGVAWDTFALAYGGAYYQLPAPVQAFFANGWETEWAAEMIAPGASLYGIRLEKDGQELKTTIVNYDAQAQPVAHCFVAVVEQGAPGPDVALELPGGIGVASTREEMVAAWGEPGAEGTAPGYAFSIWGGPGAKIEVGFEDDGAVRFIRVYHQPEKLYD